MVNILAFQLTEVMWTSFDVTVDCLPRNCVPFVADSNTTEDKLLSDQDQVKGLVESDK